MSGFCTEAIRASKISDIVICKYYNFFEKFCNALGNQCIYFCLMKIKSYVKFKNMSKKGLGDKWNEMRGKFRGKFAVLNDNDRMFEEDSKNGVFKKIRNKLGKTKEEFHKIFELYNQLQKL